MNSGTWAKGKRRMTGKWKYNWSSDSFTVVLDSKDRTTGRTRIIQIRGDSPEWNGFKLQREKQA